MQRGSGYVLAGLYSLLLLVVCVVAFVAGADGEHIWIYMFLLGIPWTHITTIVVSVSGFHSLFIVKIITIISIVTNIMLLYHLGTWIAGWYQKRNHSTIS